MEINEDNTQDTPYEQGYKKILAAERKAYMPSSVVGDGSRREHLEAARDHVSSALDRDQKRESVVGETTERIIAGLSRAAHGGQEITFTKCEGAEDMVAVHSDTSAATMTFGTAVGRPGVDLFFQQDGTEHYVFITRESWDTVCAHLVETNLHPKWSYAQQFAFGSSNVTMHKPRGLIVKQDLSGMIGGYFRVKLAKKFKRPIYTALELTDGSTVWERWR